MGAAQYFARSLVLVLLGPSPLLAADETTSAQDLSEAADLDGNPE